MIIRYPKGIKENDVIGITAISSTANIEKLEKAEENLVKLGYRIKETENVREQYKLVSSSGKTRAEEFMSLWEDKDVPYIISARGGEFSMEMIPYLHEYKEELNTLQPKWMQGYSDTSLINFYLTTNYNIATIHAQNIGDYAMKNYHKSLIDTINMAKLNENDNYVQHSYDKYTARADFGEIEEEYNLAYDNVYKRLDSDGNVKVSGRLIGGCIDVIKTILGTKYDNVNNFCNQFKEGMIWYLENCEMSVTDLYRSLWQMREAGWFNNVNAFLIGRSYSTESIAEFTYLDALNDALKEFNVPIIYDVDLGHIPPQMTYINGAFAEFEYINSKGILEQKYI